MNTLRPELRAPRYSPHPWFRLHHALLLVLLLGGVVRIAATASLSLIITNDGTDYLDFAQRILDGNWQPARADRTPGYPALLAAIVALFGPNPVAVLAVQHALGLGAALLLTWTVSRVADPVAGAVTGLCVALDPYILTYESYLLTEGLTVPAIAGLAAATLLPTRRRWLRAAALGVALAMACLLRSTFQTLAPFCVLGWLLATRPGVKASLGLVAVVVLAAGAVLAPWLAAQHASRGRAALSFGTGAHLFSGVARLGLVDESYALSPEAKAAYAPFAGRPMSDGDFWRFAWSVDGLQSGEPLLRDWALASIRAQPLRYAEMVLHALGWQLNCPLPRSPLVWAELDEAAARLARDGDGRQYEPGPTPNAALEALNRETAGGPIRALLDRLVRHARRGLPQVPLFLAASVLCVWALKRRDIAIAGLLLGTFAFVAMHALFLFPNPRYAMPAWACWYLAPPVLVYWVVSRAKSG